MKKKLAAKAAKSACDTTCALGRHDQSAPLPSGGPLKLPPQIARLFLARIASITAGNCDACGDAALAEAKRIVRALSSDQRGYAALVGAWVANACV